MGDITEAFEDLRIEPQTIGTYGEWVVIDAKVTGHGRTSQVDIAADMTLVWRVRDGKATWGTTYFQRADAIREIGLTEGDLTLAALAQPG